MRELIQSVREQLQLSKVDFGEKPPGFWNLSGDPKSVGKFYALGFDLSDFC